LTTKKNNEFTSDPSPKQADAKIKSNSILQVAEKVDLVKKENEMIKPYLYIPLISAAMINQVEAFERKPVMESYYTCGYEANKALLSGPGRQNQEQITQVMHWCMLKEGYRLDDAKQVQIMNVPLNCADVRSQTVFNVGCYTKNNL
jgi:hypothetical protein